MYNSMYFPEDLPPGWYKLRDGYKRYHDEHGWTDHFLPVDAQEPATPPGSGPAAKQRRSGHPLTVVAAVLIALLITGGAVAAYAYSAGALPFHAALPASTASSTHATSAHHRTSAIPTHRASHGSKALNSNIELIPTS